MSKSILLCTDDPGVGGVAQYTYSILCGLTKLGYTVTCVQTSHIIKDNKPLGIPAERWLKINTLDDFKTLLTNTSSRPNLIVFSNCNPFSNFNIKQIAIQLNVPYIVVENLVEPHLAEQFPQYLDELSYHYSRARSVIAVSSDNLSLLHQLFRLPKDKGQVIYYGRPLEYFTPPDSSIREYLRQSLNIPPNAVVCFTAARIEARKGYQYQVEAIKQLIHSSVWSQLYFVWAGAGIFDPQLELKIKEEVKQLGITDKVIFLGQRSDVSDWLNAADIFVFPSQLEGMPLCVMEAMAKGLPVIASAVSGIPEELGATGKLLADPKIDREATVRDLSATIQEWVADPHLRESLGQACKLRAMEMFGEERMIQETVAEIERALLPKGDYVSPGLSIIKPDEFFPNMVIGDTDTCRWPYLRREIPHNWYVDRREPIVGFLSRDEAHILYNTALKFKGKRALEIGCWLGWSACHLALAGVELDVVDPLLARSETYESVSSSLKAAGVLDKVNLVAGFSPRKVEEIAKELQGKWSLIFIDGDHEGQGPLNDAITCEQLAEEDALVVFHDLASPYVAKGLDYFKEKGWRTMVYQTMQIMGVAWRGNVEPVMHQPDTSINWVLPSHLRSYLVSNLQNNYKEIIDSTTGLNVSVDLTYLANKYGSDKGNLVGCKHGYTDYYEFLFRGWREKNIKLLELGLLVGGPELYQGGEDRNTNYPPSVGMWKEYFPNAHIYGFDISEFSGFEDESFTFIRGDLGKDADYQRILNISKIFDIIIDDGSHASYHQQLAFINLFDSVKPGGYYIIEDLQWQPPNYEELLPKVPITYNFLNHYLETGTFLPSALFDNSKIERLSNLVQNIYFQYENLYDANGFPVRKIPKLCVIQKKSVVSNFPDLLSPSIIVKGKLEQAGVQLAPPKHPLVSSDLNDNDYESPATFVNSSRLKVTFCTCDAPNFTGGPNIWLRRLLPFLKQSGVEVRALFFVTTATPEACPCFRDLSNQGIDCQAFSWHTTTEQKIDWLLSNLSENPPDVFVPNMLVAAFYASRWVKEAGIPTIGLLHSDDEFHQGVFKTFVRGQEAYRLSSLVCVSKFLEQYALNQISANNDKDRYEETEIERIPCGVPLPDITAQPPSDCLKLIYVGRLDEEQKQISQLTRALCRAVSQVPNVEAVIVGEGAARANVESILSDEGKGLPIELMGLIDSSQIQKMMSDNHVFVLLSDYEGLPIALMEAMSCGLVPICLRTQSGVPELVEDGVTGLLVDDREKEFISAVELLRSQPDLWKRLSVAARDKIANYYSSELCNAKWLSLLQKLQGVGKTKLDIRNPKPLKLPPVYPAFLREDYRESQQSSLPSSPKIVVDGVFFQLYNTGIARVWRSLLAEWVRTGFANYIVVLDRNNTAPKIDGVWYRTIPAYSYDNTESDRAMLQQICDEEGASLFISTYYTTPLNTPSVFMAYDMIPEVMKWDLNNPMWKEKHYAIQHASSYISISENTATDIVNFFPEISPESIRVAYCGVQDSFRPATAAEIDRFKQKYGIRNPYFILVGTGGYKNPELFLKAFSQLPTRTAFDLVFTGASSLTDEFRDYTAGSTAHFLQLSDAELRLAYSGAIALVYPSKYEGFGLPVLEALACGCPVITCPNASIPEVAGEAALYLEDDDVEAMADALCEVQKPSLREAMISAGLEQAQKFSWSSMADKVSSVLIDATLSPLNLQKNNLVIFPDWRQDEEDLGLELMQAINYVASSSEKQQTTLLIDLTHTSEEEANLMLSSVAMNLLMEAELDVSEGPEISLVSHLGKIQWQALLPKLQGRIALGNDNPEAIARAQAENLPVIQIYAE